MGATESGDVLGNRAHISVVRAQLDDADLFVLPSLGEGLPRSMIEAMARALPCIGSTAGGIPELLPQEDLVPPGDARALAQKIREVLTNPHRLTQMSARNLATSQQYCEEKLQKRCNEICRRLKSRTQAWMMRGEVCKGP